MNLDAEIKVILAAVKALGKRVDRIETELKVLKGNSKTSAIGKFVELEPDSHQTNGEKIDDRLI